MRILFDDNSILVGTLDIDNSRCKKKIFNTLLYYNDKITVYILDVGPLSVVINQKMPIFTLASCFVFNFFGFLDLTFI